MKDLTGQRFGRLVALQPTDKRVDQLVVWRCLCDCGNEVEAVGAHLTKGTVRSCGCLRREKVSLDLTGQRFGRLIALRPTDKRVRSSVVWECACDCGNSAEVPASALRSGQVRSCGCLRANGLGKDLTGQRFGRLVALRPIGRKHRGILWECACDCGNVKQATTNQLTSGKVRSCGCLRREGSGRVRAEELVGRRFGRLTVIGPATGEPPSNPATGNLPGIPSAGELPGAPAADDASGAPATADAPGRHAPGRFATGGAPSAPESGKHAVDDRLAGSAAPAPAVASSPAKCRCRCDCGRELDVAMASLRSGNTRSCGCLRTDATRRDISGQRFGKLVALRPTDARARGSVVWECACDCGNTCQVALRNLADGHATSCGCEPSACLPRNIAGRRFGSLTAIEPTDERDHGSVVWRCVCECGTFTNVSRRRLQDGTATSCGYCD